jgi:TonB-dependent receptor
MNKPRSSAFRASLLSLAISATTTHAQTDPIIEEVVVTGYKASLQNATDAKRESTALVDSIFAEDIGKFADSNIADAINRMPGIQITRNVFGDGTNVSIRGLGTSFTKVTLNGTQIAVASAGSVDSQNQNREIDLDLFPTELFTRFDVQKTSTASMLEGGASGNINIRNARPFDNSDEGFQTTLNAQAIYTDINDEYSPKISALASWRDEKFGVLGGISLYKKQLTTEGFETIGWTNLNTTHRICGTTPSGNQTLATTGGCNPSGGNNWNIAGLIQDADDPNFGYGQVPENAGAGLAAGTIIDQAFLLNQNPGLNITQISEALIPRLGRSAHMDGDQDRLSGLLSLEYRPTDSTQFYLDVITADQSRDFDRYALAFIGRNGTAIPTQMVLDSHNVVQSATFAGAQFMLEARPYTEELDFYSINPGAHFEFGDMHTVDLQLNTSRSDWRRSQPTVLVNTPIGQVDYVNGEVPMYNSAVDINNPDAGWTWTGGRVNIQLEERDTETEGLHLDYRFGDDANNIKIGLAKDKVKRAIRGYDNSGRWEDVVCRNGLDSEGNSPTTGRADCNGLNPNSAIPQSALSSYLRPGAHGFVAVDFDRFFADSNYYALANSAPEGGGSATGAQTGIVDEDTWGGYIELNATAEIGNREARLNLGGRYIETDQIIAGPVTINAQPNANPPVPAQRFYSAAETNYNHFLPSLNISFDVAEDVVLRFSASRTMTRPNPSAMLPATNFSDPSGQNASQGNPGLSPYLSTNMDFGGEWYTGDEGYVGVTLFGKQLTGFTVNQSTQVPFSQLPVAAGNPNTIPFDSLSPNAQDAINSRGGPEIAEVTVTQQVNSDGNLEIEGIELTWVQPLDVLLSGLGFNANYTHIYQRGEGQGAPAQAIGVSPETYNFTTYWENYGASVRLTYVWNDEQWASGPNQNGIPFAQLKTDARGQFDLSASYDFADITGEPQISLNVMNLTNEPMRQTFHYDSATFSFYEPGMTVSLGVRASF